jgi:hypothetical protein
LSSLLFFFFFFFFFCCISLEGVLGFRFLSNGDN